MNSKELFNYYSSSNIIESIASAAENREISVATKNGGHMTRPQTINYPRDVLEFVRKGGVSFHGSVEHWKNPISIRTGMPKNELADLRSGWDLIIDIDSSIGMDAAKAAANRVVEFLRSYGVEPGVKFSGNRGFHIGVPWESIPDTVDFQSSTTQFPRLPRAMASYIKERVKDNLFDDLRDMHGSVHELMEELGDTPQATLSPYAFVDIENNWGSRHLFRLPYSLNEKSWLVSLPISPDEIGDFEKSWAEPSRVMDEEPRSFLEPNGRADELLVSAVDWHTRKQKEKQKSGRKKKKRKKTYTKRIPEERFPPCIKLIKAGLGDGRKRSILILVNFLQQMNWEWEEIEEAVREANSNNDPPLPDSYINSQLNWFRRANDRGKKLLPPNCDNDQFYKSFGICQPDARCKKGTDEIQVKNPVSYPFTKPQDD